MADDEESRAAEVRFLASERDALQRALSELDSVRDQQSSDISNLADSLKVKCPPAARAMLTCAALLRQKCNLSC